MMNKSELSAVGHRMQEEWRAVVGFEGSYEVSSLGRVRSIDRYVRHKHGGKSRMRGRVLRPHPDRKGYDQVGLSVNCVAHQMPIHTLVAKAFIGPKPFPLAQVNHKDLNKTNNAACNLEWTTAQANMMHAKKKGRFHAMTNPNMARKLTRSDVDTMRHFYKVGMPQGEISKLFKINKSNVSLIICKKSWGDPVGATI